MNKELKRISLLGGIIIITLPLNLKLNSLSIILFVLYSSYLMIKSKKINYKINKDVLILVLPFLYALFQGLYSEQNIYLNNIIRLLSILIFPIIFYYLSQIVNLFFFKKKILQTLIYASLLYSLYLLIIAFYRQFLFSPNFEKINWYFFTYHDFTEALNIQPTYLGLYNCLAIVSVLYIKKINRINKFIIISFLTIIIFLSGSRISLVSLIMIFIFLFIKHYYSISIKIKLSLLFLFIIIPTGVFVYVPIVKERMVDMTFGLKETYKYAKYGTNIKFTGGISPRLVMWNCAFKISNNSIFFGNGYGNTQKLLNRCYRQKGYENFANLNYQTHNLYFSYLARGGVIGLLILLLLYFYSVFNAVFWKDYLHTSFIILIVITSITENILNLHFGIVFFAFFNSLFFYSNKTTFNEK